MSQEMIVRSIQVEKGEKREREREREGERERW
jgi:hypothetical protein